jgi:hypothetical protein
VPEREITTQLQVSTLLNIAGTMMGALLVPHHNFEPHHRRPELDGGCQSAAEMTFIECCNALTEIIRDKSRWSLEVTKVLELQAVKINQTHIEVLQAQKKSIDGFSTPSYRFKPTLVRLSDGMYAAFLGDLASPETSLVGIGKTAEAAFKAFDMLFSGQVPNDMVDYLLAHEEKLKQQNEKLDDTRTRSIKRRKATRRKPRGNSETTPPDQNSGGPAS